MSMRPSCSSDSRDGRNDRRLVLNVETPGRRRAADRRGTRLETASAPSPSMSVHRDIGAGFGKCQRGHATQPRARPR